MELTISAVAQQSGVSATTIRYYESIDLLPAPRRVNGRRRYDTSIFERLSFIQTTQQLGFSLGEIQRLFHHHQQTTPLPQLWRELAQQKMAELEQLMAHARHVQTLLQQGLHCGCPTLAECIDCVIAQCNPAPPAAPTGAIPA